ncbi:MAG: GtrA family protein [Pseudomonadota bacterium]|nr:GtrA family protein [Sphingomonas sp.]MDQ3479006.1 GtrA family protein [Pseudomonadota bacterium]
MIDRLPADRREMVGQLLRFIVTGALVTALGVGVYALAALVLDWHPQLANILAYLAAMATGYVMHSRWSFRDHGTRTRSTSIKFVVVSLISLGLNSSWIAIMTGPMALSPAWPILPMLFVTPAVTFVLNRQWVFA